MPINLATINQFYGKNMSPLEVKEFLNKEIKKYKVEKPKNLEEQAINLIGKPLYNAFIKGYTSKQWESKLTELPASIIKRLPDGLNDNPNYFNDTWEGIPVNGYTAIFKNMLNIRKSNYFWKRIILRSKQNYKKGFNSLLGGDR